MASSAKTVTEGVAIQGLRDMQRVLRQAEHEVGPQLQKRLRTAGEDIVAPVARRNAPRGLRASHRGRRLADTIKVSVTQRGSSVYSTSAYGGVQNSGGRVGRHHATVLRRAQVSQYMTTAVRATRGDVSNEVEGILDWLQHELGS